MKTIRFLVVTFCVTISFGVLFALSALAQTNPTISNPYYEGGYLDRADVYVSWNAVSGASYKLYLRDTSTNLMVLNGISVSGTSYTIPKKYFYEGHSIRIAISATVGSTVTWGEKM